MNKTQAIDNFWNGFDWPAYNENSVPDNVTFPYITYSLSTDSLGGIVSLNASLWDRSNSWERLSLKSDEIARDIKEHGHRVLKLDDGYVWLTGGTPFAQRLSDPEDTKIKRIYLNVLGEFLTAY